MSNSHEEYMENYKEVSSDEYDTFIKGYTKKHNTYTHYFAGWEDTYLLTRKMIMMERPVARVFVGNNDVKYYIWKEVL